MTTEEQAIAWFHSAGRFPGAPGLVRITALMERLGNPQDRLRFVHIAGTNGKGSTAAMTAAVLFSAGYRTGLYTSPFLERFRERIRVDGEPVAPEALVRCARRVRGAVEAMEREGLESPGEFEEITAAGFLAFEEAKCDFVVLETGLGGRFDATNVIRSPLAAAITSISLDHTALLGNTVEEIAFEKCGILKPGSRAVMSPDQPEGAAAVIRRECAGRGIPLACPDREALRVLQIGLDGTEFEYRGRQYRLPLLGPHQIGNALTALELAEALRAAGVEIPEEAASRGLASVSWPGRLELLSRRGPAILLDTAHNPGGMAALCAALDLYFPGVRPVAVMGMYADKDYEKCISMLAPRCGRFIAVSAVGPRALPPEECARAAARFCAGTEVSGALPAALERGKSLAGTEGLLLLCGSIALVGAGRTYLKKIT